MAAGEDDKKKEQGKGFAGLSSLVSDVDTTPPPAAKKTTTEGTTETASGTSRPAPQPAPPKPQPAPQQPYKPPQQPGSGSSSGKWWIGIAAVIGVLWLIGQSNKNTSSPAPAYSPPAQTAAPSYSPPPAQPQVPSRPAESKPPVGQDLVFSREQIAYCVAEDIRMEGAKSAVDNYSDSDVDRFNAMVADYNSRCSNFRYRRGALEGVRSSIEPYRSQLYSEGQQRLSRYRPQGSISTPPPNYASNTRPSATARTHSSPQDGSAYAVPNESPSVKQPKSNETDWSQFTPVAPPAVPAAKSNAPANSWVSGSNWYCNDGYRKVGDHCEKLNVPTNAWVSGSNWYCNDGFRKVGDQCEALNVPSNAWVSGSNWYCNDGYRKVGDRCEKLNVPPHAWVSGSNWYCNDGFRKVGEQCEALNVPSNAWVSGSNWYCNDGYRKVGDKCISVFTQ